MRLQQAALPGETLLGAATRALVGDGAEVEPIEPIEPGGTHGPIRPSASLALDEGVGVRRLSSAAFVGRQRRARSSSRRHSSRVAPSGGAGCRDRARRRRHREDAPRIGARLLARRAGVTRSSGAASRTARERRTSRSPRSCAQIAPERPQATIERLLEGDEHAAVVAERIAELTGQSRGHGADRRALLGRAPALRRASRAAARSSSSSRTCTGRSRRCSTSSSTSPRGRSSRRSCSCASRGPGCAMQRPGLGTEADVLRPRAARGARRSTCSWASSAARRSAPRRERRDRLPRRRKPALRRAAPRLSRRGWAGGARDGPADGRGAAREPPRPPRARRARPARARRRRRSGVCARSRRAPDAAGRAHRPRSPAASPGEPEPDSSRSRGPRATTIASASTTSSIRDVAYAGITKERRADLHERHGAWLDTQTRAGRARRLPRRAGAPVPPRAAARATRSSNGSRRWAGERLAAAGIRAWKRADTAGDGQPARPRDRASLARRRRACRAALRARRRADARRAISRPAKRHLVEAIEAASAARDQSIGLRAQIELAHFRLFSDPEGALGRAARARERRRSPSSRS